jgi:hypothetical protein
LTETSGANPRSGVFTTGRASPGPVIRHALDDSAAKQVNPTLGLRRDWQVTTLVH